MNRDEAKQLLPIIQAFAEGKEIEWRVPQMLHWAPAPAPTWDSGMEYRIKPEPKLRPWRNEECPKVFVAEWKNEGVRICRIAVKQNGFDHVRFMGADGQVTQARIPFDELLRDWNRITEDGTEHPCGVLEAQP